MQATATNGLVVITQLDPISVIFTMAEDQLPPILAKMHAGQQLTVEAWDRELKNKLADGKLETIDNQIDPTTGTLKLRAVFANTNGKLYPSQFVNARLLVEQKQNITLLANAAIQRNSQGTYVWMVQSGSNRERASHHGGHHRRRPIRDHFRAGAGRHGGHRGRGPVGRRRQGERAGSRRKADANPGEGKRGGPRNGHGNGRGNGPGNGPGNATQSGKTGGGRSHKAAS